ncbi:MAG: hypothetical protein ACR2IE_00230 [Candidatus Sumerlaeaceae bacterium]
MRMETLRIGMKVQHTSFGAGIVRGIAETGAEIDFGEARRTISAADSALHPGEPMVSVAGLDVPLPEFLRQTAQSVLRQLGIESMSDEIVDGLARRWRGGKLVMQSTDGTTQPKEVDIETFFHKIVMMRNNLRVLEQKLNAHTGLSEAEKIELQQYITRCYGSMTTFNVLFKDKEDQF